MGAGYWGFLFLLPILALFMLFKFYPIARALVLSFTDSSSLNSVTSFVGFGNYVDLSRDAVFLRALRITAGYVAGTVIPLLVFSLGLALILNQKLKGRGFFRVLLFLPAIVPYIVIPILWRFLFHPYGLVNNVIGQIGLGPFDWLTNARTVVPAFIISTDWRLVPLFMIIYLAGLQAIPEEIYDAARVDGAGTFGRFRWITLPLLRPTTLLVLVIAVSLTATSLVQPLVMTEGGPAGASRFVGLYIFEIGFRLLKHGYASAASMILLIIIVTFTLVVMRLSRDSES